MATLSADQLSDIQADLGISDDEAVFTDAALNRLFTRADSDYELTVAYAVRQLLFNAARFNDYTAGLTAEKKSQVFEQLRQMYQIWMTEAGAGAAPLTASTIQEDFIEPREAESEYT